MQSPLDFAPPPSHPLSLPTLFRSNIVSPSEIVVVTSFHVELEGGGGDVHVTMPYSMIEPLREALDSGMTSDRIEHDERWAYSLKDEDRKSTRLNSSHLVISYAVSS